MASSKCRLLILIGICCLALVNKSNAKCCNTKKYVNYKMGKGLCEDVGGNGDDPENCEIIICADGVAKKGSYCGKGPCNFFGCNCDGGCLTGHWVGSFLRKNRYYEIEILYITKTPFSLWE